MECFEEMVMNCVVANGETFVSPQFDLGRGWSRLDFVAIRPPKKKAYLVEVTAHGSATDLIEKINKREHQWLSQLREALEQRQIATPDWAYQVLAFVRRDQYSWFKGRINAPAQDVTVLTIEDA